MKKILAIAVAMLAVMGTMASCGNNADNEAYKDGSYRVEAKDFDDHGWKEYINVTVKDGKISEVEFDALSQEDGHKKTEDQEYKDAYTGAGFETYPADYTEKLEKGLVEKQDASKVDTVAGATNSSNAFKQMMRELDKNMKKGDTNTVTVTVANEE